MQLTLREVAEAACAPAGTIGEDRVLAGVSTDTRILAPGELFVALANERADGHFFALAAQDKGAVAAVVSRPVPGLAIPELLVDDTERAYGRIARAWREKFTGPVIGITGSVGKTTTKEMTAAALAPLGEVVRTEKSQNNETGVPRTVLRIGPQTGAAVIEMGMRGTGQIAYLAEIARPTVAAITAIAENHIELLGSLDAIADAKAELLNALPPGGAAVLNASDPYFRRLRSWTAARVVTVDVERDADFAARKVEAVAGGWRCEVNGVPVFVASASRHDIGNALIALALAVQSGVALPDAAAALSEGYHPPAMRMQIEPAEGWGGTILNDCYNAAPASTRSALETLASQAGGRRIAFLGDMRELGDHAPDAHRSLGSWIESLGGIDRLYTVGGLAAEIPGAARRFADSEEAARFAASEFDAAAGDVVLVKGSRAMQMEKIVDALRARGTGAADG